MKVYFHGGPLDGQFQEIPDGRDWWQAWVRPKELDLPFKELKDLPTTFTAQIVTYVPCSDVATYIRLGLARETIGESSLSVAFSPVVVFVPRNTVDEHGRPGDHRMN